jgi:Glycosyltransferase involved in LPS biosynthesis
MNTDVCDVFQQVYCINLDRRPDRWEAFLNRVPADWPFGRIQRVSAIDGAKTSYPNWWTAGGGAWGCYRSHLMLIENALNSGVQSLLILEDDAMFVPEFSKRAMEFLTSVPDDWGMIYLGGQHLKVNKNPPVRVGPGVYRPFNVNRTHGYALKGEGIAAVYRHLTSIRWKKRHHIDHHLGEFHERQCVPIYCPEEWLIGQADGESDISGNTADERFWISARHCDVSGHSFVAVLGLHSSGSSCLAGVLHHLGLHLGNVLTGYYGNDPRSRKCGFEAVGLRDLCEKAIPFPACRLAVPNEKADASLRHWINEKRREAAMRKTIAAGKYPQLCRLGPQLLEICGKQLKVIVSERPLAQSIESLQRRCPRQNAEQLKKHQLWLEEGKQWLLNQIPAENQLTVAYEDLLRSPSTEAKRISGFLGIELTEARMQAIQNWVDPAQQHVKGEAVCATR